MFSDTFNCNADLKFDITTKQSDLKNQVTFKGYQFCPGLALHLVFGLIFYSCIVQPLSDFHLPEVHGIIHIVSRLLLRVLLKADAVLVPIRKDGLLPCRVSLQPFAVVHTPFTHRSINFFQSVAKSTSLGKMLRGYASLPHRKPINSLAFNHILRLSPYEHPAEDCSQSYAESEPKEDRSITSTATSPSAKSK